MRATYNHGRYLKDIISDIKLPVKPESEKKRVTKWFDRLKEKIEDN